MQGVKTLTMCTAVALSLIGASSAAAAIWDPQNTNVTMTQEGTNGLTANSNVSCTSGHTILRAVGAVASTINTTNPVSFTGCSNPLLGTATVTTFGTWTFTATSTTAVDVTITSTTGVVAVIAFPSCNMTVPSPVHIGANTWNNTTHTLAVNRASSFGLVGHGICNLFGTSMQWDVNFVASLASIT